MFVLVAKFVSFEELKTESKNTHKISCDIIPSFSPKYFKLRPKDKKFSFDFLLSLSEDSVENNFLHHVQTQGSLVVC